MYEREGLIRRPVTVERHVERGTVDRTGGETKLRSLVSSVEVPVVCLAVVSMSNSFISMHPDSMAPKHVR